MNRPAVSIIMRSFNEAWALRDTLPALKTQTFRDWELIVIDSGSTDGSPELIRQMQPRHFLQIAPGEYNPSRVMNEGMRLAQSEFGIFLNADATPQGRDWLEPLVDALRDPRTAAVFGRQIPRPDCRAVYAHDYDRCFGPQRESIYWDHFFSMASSGIRKDIWAQRGFDERLQYSEDDEYTRWCRAQGYTITYVPQSVVMHSHNYTPAQAYKRRDFVAPTLVKRTPQPHEAAALRELDGHLARAEGVSADELQTLVYEIGKREDYGFENLRDWFKALYQTLLGSDQGPRMGSFIALYGIPETRRLIADALARG